ncbi:MAG: hypothetical protein ACR2PL_24380, partial [Dehalococcoidia bacterium]
MDQDTVVLIGHMLDFQPVRAAATAFGRGLAGGMIVPEPPGLAVAHGALSLALGKPGTDG